MIKGVKRVGLGAGEIVVTRIWRKLVDNPPALRHLLTLPRTASVLMVETAKRVAVYTTELSSRSPRKARSDERWRLRMSCIVWLIPPSTGVYVAGWGGVTPSVLRGALYNPRPLCFFHNVSINQRVTADTIPCTRPLPDPVISPVISCWESGRTGRTSTAEIALQCPSRKPTWCPRRQTAQG